MGFVWRLSPKMGVASGLGWARNLPPKVLIKNIRLAMSGASATIMCRIKSACPIPKILSFSRPSGYALRISWLRRLRDFLPAATGGVEQLFAGALCVAENGLLYVGREHVPDFSLLFWRADRDLTLWNANDTRLRYSYKGDERDLFLAYRGLEAPEKTLPANTLLCLSLAQWWKADNAPEQAARCYLQLCGWFPEAKPNLALDLEAVANPPIQESLVDEAPITVRAPRSKSAAPLPFSTLTYPICSTSILAFGSFALTSRRLSQRFWRAATHWSSCPLAGANRSVTNCPRLSLAA